MASENFSHEPEPAASYEKFLIITTTKQGLNYLFSPLVFLSVCQPRHPDHFGFICYPITTEAREFKPNIKYVPFFCAGMLQILSGVND